MTQTVVWQKKIIYLNINIFKYIYINKLKIMNIRLFWQIKMNQKIYTKDHF